MACPQFRVVERLKHRGLIPIPIIYLLWQQGTERPGDRETERQRDQETERPGDRETER